MIRICHFFSIIIEFLLVFVNVGYFTFRKWMEIAAEFKHVIKKDAYKRVELAEASTAAMRAILQRLVEIRANVFGSYQLTCDVIQPMLNDVHQCVSTNVRVNMIRILCNLVQMLNNKDSKNYETIKVIIFVFPGSFCPSKIFLSQLLIFDSLFPPSYWISLKLKLMCGL